MEMNNKVALLGAIETSNEFLKRIASFQASAIQLEDDDDNDVIIRAGIDSLQRTQPNRIENYVERIVSKYSDQEFQRNFRVSRAAYEFLLGKLIYHFRLDEIKSSVNAEKQLLAVIWLLATPESYRSVGERFNLAKSTLSSCFFRIIDFLNKIASEIIKFPSPEEKEEIKAHFESFDMIGVIGAIDGCYIPAKVPRQQKAAYTNRKCFTSVTLQAVCDHKMKYLDCFIGFPSSVHDCRIFKNSDLYENVTANRASFFSTGEKILGDKAYPFLTWCIPPYINRGRLTDKQKYFNTKHASSRVVIERSFALLFGRFRRLRYIDMNLTEKIPATILAACVLHNVCLTFNDSYIEEYLVDGESYAHENIPSDAETQNPESMEIQQAGVIERNSMADYLWARRNN